MDLVVVTDDRSLQISISGSRLATLGFTHGKKVAIEEEYGRITIRLLSLEYSRLDGVVEVP